MSTISGTRLIEAHEALMRVYWLRPGQAVDAQLQNECMEIAVSIKIALGMAGVEIEPQQPIPAEAA